jgi:hypothetical protein
MGKEFHALAERRTVMAEIAESAKPVQTDAMSGAGFPTSSCPRCGEVSNRLPWPTQKKNIKTETKRLRKGEGPIVLM